MKSIFSLVKILLFAGVLFFFYSCGGGSSGSSIGIVPATNVATCVVDYYNRTDTDRSASLCIDSYPSDKCSTLEDSDEEVLTHAYHVSQDCSRVGFPKDSFELIENQYSTYSMDTALTAYNEPIIVDSVVTISSKGGEYDVSDLKLQVPVGAISGDIEIKAGKSISTDEDSISDLYVMTGVIDKLKKPITIKIPLNNNLIDNSAELFLLYAPAQGGYSTSYGDTSYIHMFDAHLEGNYVVGDIYNFMDSNVAVNREKNSRGLLDWVKNKVDTATGAAAKRLEQALQDELSILQAQAMHRESTSDGQFMVYYPVTLAQKNPTLDFLDLIKKYFNRSTDKLKRLDFEWDSLRKPIPVVIVDDNQMGSQEIAVQTKPIKFATNKYPMIKIKKSELLYIINNEDRQREDILGATMGHEFFHCVQNLYDPTWFNDESHVFIAETSSVWFEYQVSTHSSIYSSNVAKGSKFFQNYGLDDVSFGKYKVWGGSGIGSKTDLGYGASTFLRYLTLAEQNDKIVYDIWANLKAGGTAVQAMDKAIRKYTSKGLGTLWRRFAIHYNTNFIKFAYKNYSDWPVIEPNKRLNISKEPSFEKTFTMPPYSANNVYIGSQDEKIEYDVNVSLSQHGGSTHDLDAYLYDMSGNQIMKVDFDDKPKIFSMTKGNARTLVLINSGDEASEVKLKIERAEDESKSSCPKTHDVTPISNSFTYGVIGGEHISCLYNDDGTLYTEYHYINNKANGIAKHYYSNGNIMTITDSYVNGILNGTVSDYTEGGCLSSVTYWVNDTQGNSQYFDCEY